MKLHYAQQIVLSLTLTKVQLEDSSDEKHREQPDTVDIV